MAATDARARGLGFDTPASTDLIRHGDNAISKNARAAVDLHDLTVSTVDLLTVTAYALPSGSAPFATVSGAIPYKTINIGVPRGAPGMGYAEGQQLLAESAATLNSANASAAAAADALTLAQQAQAAALEVPDTNTAAMIGNPETDTRQALDASYGVPRMVQQRDVERISALLRSGKGVRYCALGDSTEAGVGHPGANVYGEAQRLALFSGPTALALGMMRADPNFIEPDPAAYPVTAPDGTSPVPRHNLVKSAAPSLVYTTTQATPAPLPELTLYFMTRTADSAPTFDVTVTGGATTTVDTWTPALTYSGTTAVLGRLTKVTVPCPTTATITYTIGNLTMVDRGSGPATDGTVYFLGATRGPGVDFLNGAISSTTLENASSANTSRGITTDDRIALAINMGADIVSMGWGTNDSKPGGLTVAAFKAAYAARIDQLRAALPGVVILLSTDPAGLGGDYTNNPAYNQAVREVALIKRVSCLDVENVMAGNTDWYSDDVHPAPRGYQAIGQATAGALGVPTPFAPVKPGGAKVTAMSTAPQASHTGNPGDLASRLDASGATIYQKYTTGNDWHIIAGTRTYVVTNGFTPNRDSTTIVRTTLTVTSAAISAPTNGYEGDRLVIYVTQGSASRTASWASAYRFAGGTAPTLSTEAGKVDRFEFEYDSAANAWREVSRSIGQN